MAQLQRRERRLLIVAGVVVILVMGYWYVIEPLMERHQRVEALLESRKALLWRQDRLVARRERYAQDERALREEIERRRARLLPSDKPPLAASELQKLVKTTAQETGVEVRSERVLPTTERGGYAEVPVEVTLSGPIRSIVAFLYRLEAAPVLVSMQDVKLRVVSVGAPRELLATLALAGYIATSTEGGAGGGRGEPARRPGA
ncbi:MAG: type II secretion system protein GspM [Candidatus Rokuibacteriota bacterium]